MEKNTDTSWKMTASFVAFVAQYFLIFIVFSNYVVFYGNVTGTDLDSLTVAFAAAFWTIFFVLLQVPFMLVRWSLKHTVNWVTFFVLFSQLALASYMRVQFHDRFEEFGWSFFFSVCFVVFTFSAVYFLYRHIIQITGLLMQKMRDRG